MSRARFAPLCAAALVAACGSDDRPSGGHPDAGHPATIAVISGDYAIRVDPERKDLKLVRGDDVLLDFPADGLELGTVPALDDSVNYDPYPLVVPSALYQPPAGLAWISPESVAVTKSSASAVDLALAYPHGLRATLHLQAAKPGSFEAVLTPAPGGPAVAYFRLRPRADAKEGFYGLGEYFDSVSHRGKVRAMQIEIDSSNESGYNEVHVPIPFLIGTRGWGLFVDSSYPGVFAVATEEPDLVEATFGTGLGSTKGLTFHLFGEKQPLDLTRHYYEVTGLPRLPARWALGPWVWRNDTKDQAQSVGDMQAMRDLDLPGTAYWLDRPYATQVNTFDFSPTQFPDPKGLVDEAHALGFRMALWHVPYLDEKAPETKALRDEAESKGYYPKTSGLPLNPWGKLLDLTNPAATSWWQGLLHTYTDAGFEGFKLDYGEDVVPGITAGRNVWEFSDGSDERTMHARYQLFYHRAYAETLPSEAFLLCRHATIGDQANVSVIWPGDLDASFARFGDTVTEGTTPYTAVGGLPATLIAGLSLGPSGFPFFGADTGGYLHSPPDKELFTRWFEQTALSTVMQIGNGGSTVAWEPDPKTGFDAEMLGWYRTYTRLHLRLFPYEWSYATRLATDGRAIQRPLGLAYPELGEHPDDTYLFGDHLLVAPVVERGKTTRAVRLPPGRWIDWWTGAVRDGGQTVMVDAPLGTLPLFLQEGGIVPMLRPTIDAIAPTTQPDQVDSYATTPGLLWARIAAGAASSFAVFDGARIGQEKAAGKVTLTAKGGAEFTSGVVFELVAAGQKPTSVIDGGAALVDRGTLAALDAASSGWVFSSDVGGTVTVKVGPGEHTVVVAP